jgi:hypothetical protein
MGWELVGFHGEWSESSDDSELAKLPTGKTLADAQVASLRWQL